MKCSFLIAVLLLLSACNKTESSINNTLQAKVDSILLNKLIELDALSGQAIVMEVQTGEIKALVGLKRQGSEYQPLDTLAIPQESELFKTMSLLAMLESGKVHLNDTVNVGNGILIIDSDTLYDHNVHRGGYGEISMLQGFAYCSNVATVLGMQKAFPDDKEYYDLLYNKMSVNKPDSLRGLNHDPYTLYVDCNYLNGAIGKHKSSPIQTIAFYNAIANNGKMVQPQLYKDDTVIINPQIASKTNIDSMKYALQYTITDGLGKRAKSDKVQVAGRPGTIFCANETYMIDFCGYFPADNPQYTIFVSINKEELPASGSMAGEVFKEIVDYMVTE